MAHHAAEHCSADQIERASTCHQPGAEAVHRAEEVVAIISSPGNRYRPEDRDEAGRS
jgi:hypothetical protein